MRQLSVILHCKPYVVSVTICARNSYPVIAAAIDYGDDDEYQIGE